MDRLQHILNEINQLIIQINLVRPADFIGFSRHFLEETDLTPEEIQSALAFISEVVPQEEYDAEYHIGGFALHRCGGLLQLPGTAAPIPVPAEVAIPSKRKATEAGVLDAMTSTKKSKTLTKKLQIRVVKEVKADKGKKVKGAAPPKASKKKDSDDESSEEEVEEEEQSEEDEEQSEEDDEE